MYLGHYDDVTTETIRKAIQAILNDADKLQVVAKKAYDLVDGKGAQRCAEKISAL